MGFLNLLRSKNSIHPPLPFFFSWPVYSFLLIKSPAALAEDLLASICQNVAKTQMKKGGPLCCCVKPSRAHSISVLQAAGLERQSAHFSKASLQIIYTAL